MPLDLPVDPPLPAMVTEHVLGEDRLRQRGAVLAVEALADLTLLTPALRGLSLSGLSGTLVTLDGLRLTPAANGRVDLSLLPLAWLGGASLSAGPGGVAAGAGALAGVARLSLAPVSAGNRLWALAGGQAGQGIGGVDLRLGGDAGWIGGGFTQGGALSTPAGLAATGQGRWHAGGRFSQAVGGATLSGRALLAGRREGDERGDFQDVAVQVAGGSAWRWAMAVAAGGHDDGAVSSKQTQFVASIGGPTDIILPGAAEPVRLNFGAEARRLRLGMSLVNARELQAQALVPVLQDRPGAENLLLDLGWRQAWIAGRSEALWHVGGRWEFFPGLALRGQVARGVDDLATVNGTGRSIGLYAAPAFVPGLVLALDWRSQAAGPARVRALDVSGYWRGRLGGTAQLALDALTTWHTQADATPLPVARLQSTLRARIEDRGWAFMAGWRHRSSLAAQPARHWLDVGVERQVSERIRLIASIGNAGDAGSAAGQPVGRQALLQLVAGF
jgi:hypothetical protein